MDPLYISSTLIKSHTYRNKIEGSVIFPEIPSYLNFQDILLLEREGLAIDLEQFFTTGTLTGRVWKYRVKYEKDSQNTPGDLFQWSVSGGLIKTRKYSIIGFNPTLPGLIYSFNVLGNGCRYTVQPGDTDIDILNGLAEAINTASYDQFSASATVEGSKLVVQVIRLNTPTWDVVYQDNYIYKTGYYAYIDVFDVLTKVLLSEQESQIEFPAINPLEPSYDYTTLTQFTEQVNDHLKPEGYSYGFWPDLAFGTTDITNVPIFPSTPSHAVYDQPNSRIVYHPLSPQKLNERSLILYR